MFPSEDSLGLLDRPSSRSTTSMRISVIGLPHIANFTDFDPLDAETTVSLNYLTLDAKLDYPDAVILPGSKTTISDLIALHQSGMAQQLQNYVSAGGVILGICGGFQMLGEKVLDPDQLEGSQDGYEGLNLLPLETIITPDKIVRQRQTISRYPSAGLPVTGYEIHQGITQLIQSYEAEKPPLIQGLFDDFNLGVVNDSQTIWGCYLHGLFDNGAWRRSWLNYLRKRRGLSTLPTGIANYREQREANLDAIADLVEEFVDLKPVFPK